MMIENNRGSSRGSNSLKLNLPSPINYKLASGKIVRFKEVTIAHKDIEALTAVDLTVNPRLTSSLTEAKLKNLSHSIKRNQFYAVVGYRRDNIIYIIDGSRRRKAAIIAGVGLRVLVTDDDIPEDELKDLVKEFQTNENLSTLEWGLLFSAELEANEELKQKDLCDIYNKTTSFISRAVQASRISPELLGLFENLDPLTSDEYDQLKKITDELVKHEISLEDIGLRVKEERCDSKPKIFKFLLAIFPSSSNNKVVKAKVPVENVVFVSRKRYINKQLTQKGKGTDFKCAGLTSSEVEKIEEFIKDLIK
ncbi:ParB N-terminal domain-containing protein [Shewanella sp. SG44-6]|uniref:ParB N-terminal domain-containing protein n=1 Tax=Shewanella sp. SG44-6 TaxID=2760959 RepID=UPI001600F7BF|nr:ParB N-terminal domain-containing protein [Shewanella sp. SG44-6]MBB1388765.1 ParB N-terminal domain-containing protein [Shewanella sp. SG44-6]